MSGNTDVVHSKVTVQDDTAYAEVTLADGRTGYAEHTRWSFVIIHSRGVSEAELISRAIADARSKPVPK
jgi:hypothetical protein